MFHDQFNLEKGCSLGNDTSWIKFDLENIIDDKKKSRHVDYILNNDVVRELTWCDESGE